MGHVDSSGRLVMGILTVEDRLGMRYRQEGQIRNGVC